MDIRGAVERALEKAFERAFGHVDKHWDERGRDWFTAIRSVRLIGVPLWATAWLLASTFSLSTVATWLSLFRFLLPVTIFFGNWEALGDLDSWEAVHPITGRVLAVTLPIAVLSFLALYWLLKATLGSGQSESPSAPTDRKDSTPSRRGLSEPTQILLVAVGALFAAALGLLTAARFDDPWWSDLILSALFGVGGLVLMRVSVPGSAFTAKWLMLGFLVGRPFPSTRVASIGTAVVFVLCTWGVLVGWPSRLLPDLTRPPEEHLQGITVHPVSGWAVEDDDQRSKDEERRWILLTNERILLYVVTVPAPAGAIQEKLMVLADAYKSEIGAELKAVSFHPLKSSTNSSTRFGYTGWPTEGPPVVGDVTVVIYSNGVAAVWEAYGGRDDVEEATSDLNDMIRSAETL